MTAIEIQQDAIYAEAYKKAEISFNKKYEKLYNSARCFIQSYEDAYGEPEQWKEFFDLKNIIEKEKIKKF